MNLNNCSKKLFLTTIAISLFTIFTLATAIPQKAEAIKIGNIVSAVKEQEEIRKSLNYYENDGRHELFEALKQEDGVNTDARANSLVDGIMKRMTAAVAKTDPSITQKPYNYFVNNQEFFNAYCSLGHNMSVNIGAIWFLNYNEDMLASVIAHELVHGQKNHPFEGAKKKMSVDFVMKTVGADLSKGTGLAAEVVAVHAKNTGITKPNEWEADNIAFTYMSYAGYNIGAPAAVWQRVIEATKDSSKKSSLESILNPSTHPKDTDRRDNYSKKLTEYSKGKVTVDATTGEVKLNGKVFMKPVAAAGFSGLERAYLVAGNLASVYNAGNESQTAHIENGTVKIGSKGIVTPASEDMPASELISILASIK